MPTQRNSDIEEREIFSFYARYLQEYLSVREGFAA
jgi:hypothetical protein